MGFFGTGDKTSTTNQTDQRQSGTDQAIVQRDASQQGGAANLSASGLSGSNVIGQGGHQAYQSDVQEGNGFQVAGYGKTGDISIHNENVDAGVIGAYGKNLKDVLETQASADSIRDVAQQNFLTGITGSLARLASSQQGIDANSASGGDIQRNRIVLYVVLGLLAVVGIWLWKKS